MGGTKNVSVSIIKDMETRIEVNPEKLEDWLVENPEKVYRRSVASSEIILEKPLLDESLLLEFEWEGSIYAKIYMKKTDVIPALQKSIDYFVSTELYEEAQKAKNILDCFKDLENN